MNIRVDDGKVIFATHLVKAEGGTEICYSLKERDTVIESMAKRGIEFIVEELSFDIKQKDKVNGKKYASRTEAIQHLAGEIDEPELDIIPNLKKALKAKDVEIQGLKNQFTALNVEVNKFKGGVIIGNI